MLYCISKDRKADKDTLSWKTCMCSCIQFLRNLALLIDSALKHTYNPTTTTTVVSTSVDEAQRNVNSYQSNPHPVET